MNREQRQIYEQVMSLQAKGEGEVVLQEFAGKGIGAIVRNCYELGYCDKKPPEGQRGSPALGAYYAGKHERLAKVRKQFTGV